MISETLKEYIQVRLSGGRYSCTFILGNYFLKISKDGTRHNLTGLGIDIIPDDYITEEGMTYDEPYIEIRRPSGGDMVFRFFYAGKIII